MIIMDWNWAWAPHYETRWSSLFPESTYGAMNFDTHIYRFKDTVQEEEQAWDLHEWFYVPMIAKEVPIMIAEYTLALNQDLPADQSQGWAEYIQERLHQNNALGGAIWAYKLPERHWWSMIDISDVMREGGINWPQAFASGY